MSYDSSERSVQEGEPTEIYTWEFGATTIRLTSAPEDVSVSAQTYTSAPISRTNTNAVPLGKVREITIRMSVEHDVAARLVANGIPLRDVRVTIERYHPGSAVVRIHRGYVADVTTDGQFASIRVPNSTDDQFSVRLPIAVSQRLCNHTLYDRGCLVDRDYPVYQNEPFMSASAVDTVDGVTIVVDALEDDSAVARPDDWAKYGEVRRVSDGERRSIVSQIGTTLTIDVPFSDLDVGDDLEVYAGCDHTVETCFVKFANVQHFGGHPDLPTSNPHAPTGYGVVTQS